MTTTTNKSQNGLGAALLLMAMTAALILLWGHIKLLWFDEFLVIQTAAIGSVGELLHVQRLFPIALDPGGFHLVTHAMTKVMGVTPFAVRFPSLIGYLGMQLCLFVFVRRIAGVRVALFAMLLPNLSGALYYATEARPYGPMLGCFGLAVLAYQAAIRESERRRGWLIVLAFSIALTLNMHYFGILLFFPLAAAELTRTIERRKLDWGVIAAIVAGGLGILLTVPFMAGAKQFSAHYYDAGVVDLHILPLCYRAIVMNGAQLPGGLQRVVMAAFALFCVSVLLGGWLRLRRRDTELLAAEYVLLVALVLLPFWGYMVGHFLTHTMAVRYIFGAVIGMAALGAISLAPYLRREGTGRALLALALVAVLVTVAVRIEKQKSTTNEVYARAAVAPAMLDRIAHCGDGYLYMRNIFDFDNFSRYEPDLRLRSHLALVGSAQDELKKNGVDSASITEQHMQHFTGFRILSYDEFKALPGEHCFSLDHTGWAWEDDAFARDGANVQTLGQAFGQDVSVVSFPAR